MKIQGLETQLKQVTQAYEEAQQALQTDQAKQQAQLEIKRQDIAADAASQERELQSKMQLEAIKQEGENARALAKIEQTRASEVLQTEVRRLEGMIGRSLSESEAAEQRYERMILEDRKDVRERQGQSAGGARPPSPGARPPGPTGPGPGPAGPGVPPSGPPPSGPPPGTV